MRAECNKRHISVNLINLQVKRRTKGSLLFAQRKDADLI